MDIYNGSIGKISDGEIWKFANVEVNLFDIFESFLYNINRS